MGIVQKDAFRTTIISYLGIALGYLNKGVLFVWFLSTAEMGLLNLLLSVGLLFGNMASLGSSYAIWKFFPYLKDEQKKNHGFLALTLITALAGGLLFSLITVLFKSEIAANYQEKSAMFVENYYWIIPLGFASMLFIIFEALLKSMYRNIVPAFVNEVLVRVIVLLLLVAYGLDLFSFTTLVILHSLAYFIPPIALVAYLYKIGELHLSWKSIAIPRRFRKIIFSFSLFSYLNSVGVLLVTTVDSMMIASMMGLRETGVYTLVIFLTSALQIPYKSMIRVASPLIADFWKERKMTDMKELYKKFSSVNLVISVTLFMGVWIIRQEAVMLMPAEFAEGVWVFLFLMIGRLVDVYMGLNGVILITSKKYRYDILFTAVLIGGVIALNLLLIPVYGMTGSAIATGAVYVAYNLARLVFVYAIYRIHPFEFSQLIILLMTTATLAIFELAPTFPDHLALTIVVKWLVFGIVFLLPIYFFNIEPEIVNYVNKGLALVKKKVRK